MFISTITTSGDVNAYTTTTYTTNTDTFTEKYTYTWYNTHIHTNVNHTFYTYTFYNTNIFTETDTTTSIVVNNHSSSPSFTVTNTITNTNSFAVVNTNTNTNLIKNLATYHSYFKTLSGELSSGYWFINTTDGSWERYSGISSNALLLSSGKLLTEKQLAWSSLEARGLLKVTTTANIGSPGSTANGLYSNNNPSGTTISELVGINNANNFYSSLVARSARLGLKVQVTGQITAYDTTTLNAVTKTRTLGKSETNNGEIVSTGIELNIGSISGFPKLDSSNAPTLISNSAFDGSFNQRFIWAGDSSSNNLQSQLGIGEVYSETIDHVTNPIILAMLGEYGMYGLSGFTSNGFFSSTLFTQTEEGQFGIKNELTSEAPFGQYLLPVFGKNTITSNFDTRNASGGTVSTLRGEFTTNGFYSLNNTDEGTIENYGFFSASTFTVNALGDAGFGQGAVNKLASPFSTTNEQVTATSVPFRVLFFDSDTTDNGLYVVSGLADYKAGELTAVNTNPTGSSAMGGRHTIVKVEGGSGAPIALSDINLV